MANTVDRMRIPRDPDGVTVGSGKVTLDVEVENLRGFSEQVPVGWRSAGRARVGVHLCDQMVTGCTVVLSIERTYPRSVSGNERSVVVVAMKEVAAIEFLQNSGWLGHKNSEGPQPGLMKENTMEQVNGTSTETATKTPAAKAKIRAFDPVEFTRSVAAEKVGDEEMVQLARSLVEVSTSIKGVLGGASAGAIVGTVAAGVLAHKHGLEGQALVDATCVGFAVGAKAGALAGWGGAAAYNRLTR
jgi:hypothetical protein